jgi:hypothetical protein
LSQLALFKESLPYKPYCTDALEHGLIIRSVAHAINHKYIQPNHPNSRLWLLYDIDRATSPEEITDDLGLPPPHIFAQTKDNGHAHALYGMELPIHYNLDSSQAAIRFAGAVDCGMTVRLQADAGYAGLICKNPLHPDWRVWSSNHELYTLEYLAEFVDLSAYKDKRKNLPAIGLGRNCTLFNRVSYWAYKAIRQGWPDLEQWLKAVETRAYAYNDFDVQLHSSEVRHIAKSIAKWTYRNLSPVGFSQWQAIQGRKGGLITAQRHDMAVRGAQGGAKGGRPSKKQEQLEMVLELKAKGYNNRAIAEDLQIGAATVSRWLNGVKS